MLDAFLPIVEGPFAPWLPVFILLILLGTAIWDARTGIVPNIPLLIGAGALGLGLVIEQGWQEALIHIGMGVGVWAAIWALNEAWFLAFKKDAVGMGDAKWTALAVAAFGPVAGGLFAWFAGSWISLLWFAGSYALGKKIGKVYFAPFLFCGLIVGLLVTRHVIALPFPFLIF